MLGGLQNYVLGFVLGYVLLVKKGGKMKSIILYIIAGVLSFGSIMVYLKKSKSFLKETAELLTTLSDAIEDDKITVKEIKAVLKEAKDIPEAISKVRGE